MDRVKAGIFKCGNIGASPVFELLLDELGDRKDIRVRTLTTGSKMNVEEVENAFNKVFDFDPDLLVFLSPNAGAPGPSKAREIMSERDLPCVVVSDNPAKRVKDEIEDQGLGYEIVSGDPLIGARREFLDPIEMAIFNSNIIKVLAITGVYRILHQDIDKLILGLKEGMNPPVPQRVIDVETIRENSNFDNPYAKVKAMAAYELAEKIAEINQQVCFVLDDHEEFVPLAASAHEISEEAARLAKEAREVEKHGGTLERQPHKETGELMTKSSLTVPPTRDEEVYQRWLQSIQKKENES